MEVVYQRVGLGRLLGHGGDGPLEDVAFPIPRHGWVPVLAKAQRWDRTPYDGVTSRHLSLRHDADEGGDGDAEGLTGQCATTSGCWPGARAGVQ